MIMTEETFQDGVLDLLQVACSQHEIVTAEDPSKIFHNF